MSFIRNLTAGIYSGDNIVNLTDVRYLPRWVILLIDVFLVVIAILLSYYLVERLTHNQSIFYKNDQVTLIILGVNLFYMFVFRTFAGIIRHSTFIDLFKIFLSCVCSMVTLGIINSLGALFFQVKLIFSTIPFLSIFFALSFLMLFVFRLAVKECFHFLREFRRSHLKKKVVVLGTDEQCVAIARAILDNPSLPYDVAGFITKKNYTKRAKLLGKPIFSGEKFAKTPKESLGIEGVIIVRETMTRDEMNEWVNLFLEKGLQILKAPSVQKVREDELAGAIRHLQIEDLLNRKPIKIENDEVKNSHYRKNILVTGGAGSIGSEILRQVAMFRPESIVVFDQAETPLYEIELEMKQKFPEADITFVLGDITKLETLERLFKKYNFNVVYHAAAYKHVPLVENNPQEGVMVNVQGTKNLALLASRYYVERFVMISTDKAVNPTNVMGASKRAAELFVQALQYKADNITKFITTRFGNVLGSNGSVIPHFKKQIENGGPVTITHPDIVRYFMTITEACELVLEAGTMGRGGEIFLFDMGEPVKILDLARRMIKLSGLEPEIDIKIIYTGLRPGEKLYEELLSDKTKTLPTHHEKIMISRDPHLSYEKIEKWTREIMIAAADRDKIEVVKILKNIVPEFKSNNSIFQILD